MRSLNTKIIMTVENGDQYHAIIRGRCFSNPSTYMVEFIDKDGIKQKRDYVLDSSLKEIAA